MLAPVRPTTEKVIVWAEPEGAMGALVNGPTAYWPTYSGLIGCMVMRTSSQGVPSITGTVGSTQ